MQRVIAQELRLEIETMAMFDKQDEEDDFNGMDLGSRDTIRDVAAVIDQNLRESRFMMIFINRSDEEVGLGRLGIPENSDCVILWTFSARLMTLRQSGHVFETTKKLRNTDVFLYTDFGLRNLGSSKMMALFREEAANIIVRYPCMRGMDLTRVVDCYVYGLIMAYHSSRSTTGFSWPAHAPNFWICDGIIPAGDKVQEIINALLSEISFECDAAQLDNFVKWLISDPKHPFHIVDKRLITWPVAYYLDHCRWLSVNFLKYNRETHKSISEKERAQEFMGFQPIMAVASSIFLLAFKTKPNPVGLPNDFFKQCKSLGVLVLSCCAFSFLSPPFLHCHTLRFLGLDHCTDDNTILELEEGGDCATSWAFLKGMRVIDLYYTDWVEILSEEKTELMANLMELNIEGVRWRWWTSSYQLQKRLPNLQRLRIIKPTYDEAAAETASSDINDPFLMDNTSLEILDLSGSNRLMRRNLAATILKATHLQVLILDGCDELEDVMISSNFSLRSFSLDGYGPAAASHRASTVELPPEMCRPKRPSADTDKRKSAAKTSIVSLRGCGRLDKLFLRGLLDLVELDLSGCAIKVLDFGTMVVDVPSLKRLFLIGCENLCAIKWGSNDTVTWRLQMVCIDTRPGSARVLGCARPPSSLGAQQNYFRFQLHAIVTDARFIRSLCAPISHAPSIFFNIRITSSAICSIGGTLAPEKAPSNKETMMIGPSDQQRKRHAVIAGLLMYGDVFTKVGDGPTSMQAFPQAPTEQSDCHIEIGGGSHSVQGETETVRVTHNLGFLMCGFAKSVHVHDVLTCTNVMPADNWSRLRWCRVERCPNLLSIFPPGSEDLGRRLETIWASGFLKARCVWSKVSFFSYTSHLQGLQHLHLRRCPSLRFALAMSSRPSLPNLETLHIIHCGDLKHVFEQDDQGGVEFPKLTTIHLHDLPALQQICEGTVMVAPALETIKIRGCWSLRRLPALKGREAGMKKPAVEVEKDVWDALEWDGMEAGHHPSLYEAPMHSRFYKKRMLRRTVLR